MKTDKHDEEAEEEDFDDTMMVFNVFMLCWGFAGGRIEQVVVFAKWNWKCYSAKYGVLR